jgi:hydroxymethylpyrimidine kinase/phosphomethylpyrimidine kinase
MLANAPIVAEVARMASEGILPALVVDPVLVTSSGHSLMDPSGLAAYLELLLPHALVVTPNLLEAAVLGGVRPEELRTTEARSEIAERLRRTGARYVVVKGGHLSGSADDVVAGPEGITVLPGTRVPTANDHGTGCSLSAAIAANLAQGKAVDDAVAAAKGFVALALAGSARWHLGEGHGPLDHFGWSGAP